MTKFFQKLCFFSLILASGLLFRVTTIAASGNYTITNYDVTANIQKDGSADISQAVTYTFKNGQTNAVYLNQPIMDGATTTIPSVVVQQDGKSYQLSQRDDGSNDTYSVINNENGLRIKVYHQISDATATFYYTYHLSQGITNYTDTAALNWQVIGDQWNTPLNNVHIRLKFADGKISPLQAWANSDAKTKVTVNQPKGRVTIAAKQLPAKTSLEFLTTFPTSATVNNTLVSKQNYQNQAKNTVQSWKDQAQAKAHQKAQANFFQPLITLLIGLVFAFAWLIFLWRHPESRQPWPEANPPHSYDLPALPPFIAQAVYSDNVPDNNALGAYLLELAIKKKIAIQPVDRKKDDYQLTLLDESLTNTDVVTDLLFNVVGDGQKVTLEQLRKYGASRRGEKQMSYVFEEWQAGVLTAAKAHKYVNSKSARTLAWNSILALISVIFLVAAIFLGNSQTFLLTSLAILALLVQAGVFAYYYRHHSPYTPRGVEAITHLRAFRHTLRDLDKIDMKKHGDIDYWAEVLPYSIAFGYNKRTIKAFKANFSEEELANHLGASYQAFFTAPVGFGDRFTASFSKAVDAYNANKKRQETRY
ncbi:MAG: DUF2207 domain-containing protein [Ligilactobacillus sp.]|nr:DUF2207 domain-containing protein [Ligilactobacillus sp.]